MMWKLSFFPHCRVTFVTHVNSILSPQCNPFIIFETPSFLVSIRKPHHRGFVRPAFCIWVFDLSDSCGGTHSQTKLRGAHMCEEKGCIQRWGLAYMQFPPPPIFPLSTGIIHRNWGGNTVHPADPLVGERRRSLGPSSAVSRHCHLRWQSSQTSLGLSCTLSRV